MGLQIRKQVELKGTYDFDEDGGATGTYSLISVPANFRIDEIWYDIQTALASTGTPEVAIGDGAASGGYFADFEASMGTTGLKGHNQDDKGTLFWDDTADAQDKKVYATADTIDLGVITAPLSAGKLVLHVRGERLK